MGYIGGQSGANANLLLTIARKKAKKYFAVARNGEDGHSFVFDRPPTGKKMADSGCLRSCLDSEDVRCGCTDTACGKVKKQAGEKHLRRWVVYEVKRGGGERDRPPGSKTSRKKKKTKKKKKKKST